MKRFVLISTLLFLVIAKTLEALHAPSVQAQNEAKQFAFQPVTKSAAGFQMPKIPEFPRIPSVGLALALTDLQSMPVELQPTMRYLWCPNGTKKEHVAAIHAINTAANHSATEMRPEILFNGALIRVDLRKAADNVTDLQHVIKVWDSLAIGDKYFHQTIGKEVIEQVKGADGKLIARRSFLTTAVPAAYLNATFPAGFIYRSDKFVVQSLGAVDGGAYLRFRGLEVGKTTLEGYLKMRGASLAEANRLRSVERAVMESKITHDSRSIIYFNGQGSRPTASRPLVFITNDQFDKNNAIESDPIANLIETKDDGHEVMLVLPNGFIEYTLWDGKQILVEEAPRNLALDTTDPHSGRLHGAISCIRCHANEDGYKSYHNEAKSILIGRGKLLTDLTKGDRADKQFESIQKINYLYAAKQFEISKLLDDARDDIEQRLLATTGVGIRTASEYTGEVYNHHEYDPVTPAVACQELGFKLLDGDTLGCATLLAAVGVAEIEDHRLIQLQNIWIDEKTGKQVAGYISRNKWEQLIPSLMFRAQQRQMQAFQNGMNSNKGN